MIDFELSDSQKNIINLLRWFAKEKLRPLSIEYDKNGPVPVDAPIIKEVKAMGLGMRGSAGGVSKDEEPEVGEEKDKQGVRQFARVAIIGAEEMAFGDAGIMMSFPGPGLADPPVRLAGTEEQKEMFYSAFRKDEPAWGAYALTEPGAGSDVAGISSSAVKDGDDYIINGTKMFITNGARAEWVVWFATVDKKLGRAGHRPFLIKKGTPGFRAGKIEKKMGLRASETAELICEDCRVPASMILGGEERYQQKKEGFKVAMGTFDLTRPMVGAMAVGIARAAYEKAVEFVKEAYTTKRPINEYQSIVEKLVTIKRKIDAARYLCWRAAWMIDTGKPNSKEASMSKAYSGQIAVEACNLCVEIMGSAGIERDNFVEKWFRDIKVFDIFEGTGQVQRLVISRRIYQYI